MPPVGAYGMELALARMLDLGYSVKASEFALHVHLQAEILMTLSYRSAK